jgi:NitT/TauT family transport system substrate-binding protein
MAGGAILLGAPPAPAAEGTLETTTVRFPRYPGICVAPQYVAEELLRAEGFADIRYVDVASSAEFNEALASGKADFNLTFASVLVSGIGGGGAITMLAGVHVGCLELFGHEGIRGIADLKGKSVGVTALGSSEHMFVSVMAAHIGLDPGKDIRWVTSRSPTPDELFADGKIDAVLEGPPMAQDLRAILKAADLCATEPARVARSLVDGRFTPRYDYALQYMSEVPYDKWREYDPEDTIRFYALRLHEAGFIKSSPQKIIADGADWRFLNEFKRELKT